MSIDYEWNKVKEFHEKFDHPVGHLPKMLNKETVQKRYKWMLEELDEFSDSKSIYEQADAMIDLIYFALGTMVEMNIPAEKLFEIVHDANMTKLWEDGKPHYNEDNKIIKPKNWVDPADKIKLFIDSLF